MSRTIGYHLTKSTYGTWLPGDSRGSWSEAWSASRGFHEAHRFHTGDEQRQDIALARMKHAPVKLTEAMVDVIIQALCDCVKKSNGGLVIMAGAIETTHVHLLLPDTGRDIESTAKWIADQTTKAIHRTTNHKGPVWTKNNWCHHIDRQEHWENAANYIDEHNLQAGRGTRPYPFLALLEV